MQKIPEGVRPFINPDQLGDNCQTQSKETIRYDYNEAEMSELKTRFFEVNKFKSHRVELGKTMKTLAESGLDQDQLVEAINELNFTQIGEASVKLYNEEIKTLMGQISQGYAIVQVDLYGFAYHDLGIMATYKGDGHYFDSRPLRATEKQRKIFPMLDQKTA